MKKPNRRASQSEEHWYNRLLKPLKCDAINRYPLFAFDVEVTHTESYIERKNGTSQPVLLPEFLCASVVGTASDSRPDYRTWFFKDRNECADFLLSRTTRQSFIAATNLEFDANQVFNNRMSDFFKIYRHSLRALIHKDASKKYKWTFIDTMNYVPASVAKLGEMVGIPKLAHPSVFINDDTFGLKVRKPSSHDEWNELRSYCERDAMISLKFMEQFQDFCSHMNMKLKLTLASTGQDYWRRNHQKESIFREPDWMIKKHFSGSFRGGMTQLYKRGYFSQPIYCYDVNSAYPYVMTKGIDGKGSYPDPSSGQYRDNGSIEHIERYEGICHAEINMPYSYSPCLALKTSEKLLFPVGRFSGWFNFYELREAMKHGAEVLPDEMIYYDKTFKPFIDAVNILYRKRQEYPKTHPYNKLIKTLMNGGLFGKWGLNIYKLEEFIDEHSITYDTNGECYLLKDNKKIPLNNYNAQKTGLTIQIEGKPNNKTIPILSSLTTALARIHLWRLCRHHVKHLIYQDTDSAHLLRSCFNNSDALGDLKLERVAENALYVAPKSYSLDNDVKWKGVGRQLKNREILNSAIEKGSIDMIRFTKMKESYRLGIKTGSVLRLTKQIRLIDNKRKWLKIDFPDNGWHDSEPLELIDNHHPDDYNRMMERAIRSYDNIRSKSWNKHTNSDLYDKHALGKKNYEEFIRSEVL